VVSVYGAHLLVQATEDLYRRTAKAAPPISFAGQLPANRRRRGDGFRVMSIVETKRRLRAHALETRRIAARDAGEIGDLVAENFLSRFGDCLDRVPPPVVSGYWPMRDEIDLRPLLRRLSARGVACALPVVAGKGLALEFRLWRPDDELVGGPFGTSEPGANAPAAVPDLVLTPLLAFDRHGGRLGYGGGFYDRSLAELRRDGSARAIGIAYDAQQIDRAPMAEYDQKLDWIVTERRVIRCAG
jgi:5-formyltetrahydrofolate cyclo-ligase